MLVYILCILRLLMLRDERKTRRTKVGQDQLDKYKRTILLHDTQLQLYTIHDRDDVINSLSNFLRTPAGTNSAIRLWNFRSGSHPLYSRPITVRRSHHVSYHVTAPGFASKIDCGCWPNFVKPFPVPWPRTLSALPSATGGTSAGQTIN